MYRVEREGDARGVFTGRRTFVNPLEDRVMACSSSRKPLDGRGPRKTSRVKKSVHSSSSALGRTPCTWAHTLHCGLPPSCIAAYPPTRPALRPTRLLHSGLPFHTPCTGAYPPLIALRCVFFILPSHTPCTSSYCPLAPLALRCDFFI